MATKNVSNISPEISVRIIEELGDCSAVAKVCEVTKSAVSQWKKNGIPRNQARFLRLRFARKEAGKLLAQALAQKEE